MIGIGPQLAQRQWRHRLVRGEESGEALGIDLPVAVRDGLERNVVHARQTGRGPACELRQLPAVAPGEVASRRADLLLDQVEIVEQPFAGRRDRLLRLDRPGQQRAGIGQHGLVLGEAWEQEIATPLRPEHVRGRKRRAVLLHLLGTEELGAKRRFVRDDRSRALVAAQERQPSDEPVSNCHAARFRCVAG